MRIAFLGGGNMASALIGGLIARGQDATSIAVIEKLAPARERLAAQHGVHAAERPDAAAAAADVVVLAVKPQDMKSALAAVRDAASSMLVISIAAGVRIEALERWLGGHRRIVRCMPNTPALIGAGITALHAPSGVGRADREKADTILRAVGEVVWIEDERLLDPVTALSGSGPAYVFWFIEHLAAAGRGLGLDEGVAMKLALHTVLGAARLAAESSQPPDELRKNVTSRGGTTEAALKVFDEERLAERLARALEAASRRGAALGDELARD
jgi:pyrroline-5-carboxylate reductase